MVLNSEVPPRVGRLLDCNVRNGPIVSRQSCRIPSQTHHIRCAFIQNFTLWPHSFTTPLPTSMRPIIPLLRWWGFLSETILETTTCKPRILFRIPRERAHVFCVQLRPLGAVPLVEHPLSAPGLCISTEFNSKRIWTNSFKKCCIEFSFLPWEKKMMLTKIKGRWRFFGGNTLREKLSWKWNRTQQSTFPPSASTSFNIFKTGAGRCSGVRVSSRSDNGFIVGAGGCWKSGVLASKKASENYFRYF